MASTTTPELPETSIVRNGGSVWRTGGTTGLIDAPPSTLIVQVSEEIQSVNQHAEPGISRSCSRGDRQDTRVTSTKQSPVLAVWPAALVRRDPVTRRGWRPPHAPAIIEVCRRFCRCTGRTSSSRIGNSGQQIRVLAEPRMVRPDSCPRQIGHRVHGLVDQGLNRKRRCRAPPRAQPAPDSPVDSPDFALGHCRKASSAFARSATAA